MGNYLLSIERYELSNCQFPGYYVASTAPINVEDALPDTGPEPEEMIAQMAEHLAAHPEDAEILVMIHGYNNPRSGSYWWYKNTCEYLTQHYPQTPKGLLLLGYRWSSEQMFKDEDSKLAVKYHVGSARQSLPKLMAGLGRVGLFGSAIGLVGSIASLVATAILAIIALPSLTTFTVILILSLLASAPIITVVLLRLTVYFRDTFRATHYGVTDLVELIRQLDSALDGKVPANSVRLSFIGHSMGAFVVTNTVRILSDVFDKNSIGSLSMKNRQKTPPANIGNAFSLGRLVLVAPDIPAESIISGRANTLRSSLRRFQEAYLFSNEGDMALRLASTAANYFSFPARTRDGGYRLGNVTVRATTSIGKRQQYGMVNQTADGHLLKVSGPAFLQYLYIREQKSLADRQSDIRPDANQKTIAELFTYFDCTDYKEQGKGVVSQALGKSFLTMWDYIRLCMNPKIDTHGGYIFSQQADWSKQLIYGLGCLGFNGFLDTLKSDGQFVSFLEQVNTQQPGLTPAQQERVALLQVLSRRCEAQGIQLLLAPERYEVDVMGSESDREGY